MHPKAKAALLYRESELSLTHSQAQQRYRKEKKMNYYHEKVVSPQLIALYLCNPASSLILLLPRDTASKLEIKAHSRAVL
jgi:hypothetical protein